MRIIPLLAVFILVLLLIWWFTRTPSQKVAKVLRQAPWWIVGGLLVLLAVTGRLPWLFALLGAAVPFVQRAMRFLVLLPMLRRMLAGFNTARSAAGQTGGQKSRVRTRFLLMELDHDTGAMTGEVLEGSFKGKSLSDLGLQHLLELRGECATAVDQSMAVLEAYLDREYGAEWRDEDASHEDVRTQAPDGQMSRAEAYEILGLEPGAGKEAILAAHKRLMQRLHPDLGGSNHLAAIINQAKDLLLA